MDKEQIDKWVNRIDDTFVGKGGIVGGDHLVDLIKHEKGMSPYLIGKFHGYVRLMDSFFDFYIETLREASARKETKWPEEIIIFTLTHIATLWRFRSSYLVFWNGYYIDAKSLLRAVLENALNIAALQSGVITIKEMFGNVALARKKYRSEEEINKVIQRRISACDRKVRSQMIGGESGLSSGAQEDLRLFMQGLHMAVHKAQTNFLWGFKKWFCKQPLPFFPSWDEGLASIYADSSIFLAWMVTKTFPLLQLKSGEFSDGWLEKYKVLDESFEEMVADFPKRLGRSVEELIQKKFQDKVG
jgi:hypothetical protein